MKKSIVFLCSFALVLGICSAAGATLVGNGDFEMVDHRIGNWNNLFLDELGSSSPTWDVYSALPGGWYSGTTGAGIEVQYDGTVVNGHSSNHYIELDSHPVPGSNSSMYQDINFVEDGIYQLSFYYRPRTNTLGTTGFRSLLEVTAGWLMA